MSWKFDESVNNFVCMMRWKGDRQDQQKLGPSPRFIRCKNTFRMRRYLPHHNHVFVISHTSDHHSVPDLVHRACRGRPSFTSTIDHHFACHLSSPNRGALISVLIHLALSRFLLRFGLQRSTRGWKRLIRFPILLHIFKCLQLR